MATRREERRARSRRGRARSSSEEARESAKDTQRIVPRGPSAESGRYKKIDDTELKRADREDTPADPER